MKRYLIPILILCLVMVSAGQIEPIHARNSAQVYQIAFASSDQDGDREIYTIDSNGNNLIQITNNTEYDSFPSWSPDGEQIVFSHESHLYIMDKDGSNQVQIENTLYGMSPSWSPDGNWIVFEQFHGSFTDIVLLDLDTGTLLNLTNTPDELEQGPIWSYDGSYILYTGTGDNVIPRITDGDPRFNVYRINPDGTGSELLFQAGTGAGDLSQNGDGIIMFGAFIGLDIVIYEWEPLTGDITNLTEWGDVAYGSQYSPDGTQIAFVYEGQLAIMDTNGENIVQLTDLEASINGIAWSPVPLSELD